MTTRLVIPPFLIQQAKALGADIDPIIEYEPGIPLVKLSQYYAGQQPDFGAEDCDMGCDCQHAGFAGFFSNPFKKLKKKATAKIAVQLAAKGATPQQVAAYRKVASGPMKLDVKKTVTGLGKGLAIGTAAVSMAVPGVNVLTGSAVAGALAAGDKLLGSKNVKNAGRVISNTKAMAALGDPAAKRAAIVLGTVAQIRQAKGVQPGQRAIPFAGKVPTKPFTQYIPKQYATKLAEKRVEQATTARKKSFWTKVKEFFGVKATVTTTARAA
jgi:hypothetical protein